GTGRSEGDIEAVGTRIDGEILRDADPPFSQPPPEITAVGKPADMDVGHGGEPVEIVRRHSVAAAGAEVLGADHALAARVDDKVGGRGVAGGDPDMASFDPGSIECGEHAPAGGVVPDGAEIGGDDAQLAQAHGDVYGIAADRGNGERRCIAVDAV